MTALDELINLGLLSQDSQSKSVNPNFEFDFFYVGQLSELQNSEFQWLVESEFCRTLPSKAVNMLNTEDIESEKGIVQNVFIDIVAGNKHYVRDLTIPGHWVIQSLDEGDDAINLRYLGNSYGHYLNIPYKQCRVDMVNNYLSSTKNE